MSEIPDSNYPSSIIIVTLRVPSECDRIPGVEGFSMLPGHGNTVIKSRDSTKISTFLTSSQKKYSGVGPLKNAVKIAVDQEVTIN